MSRMVVQPLESYRLAQYTTPIPCHICTAENKFDAEFCHHCLAPMALAHQANHQKISPRLVAVLGSAGAGKTVYLGILLDMLSRQPGKLQVLARGAFSITLQQKTIAALARCEFPEQTASEPNQWNWVHCQVRGANQGRAMELILPDIAGDALMEEVDHPNTFPMITPFLKKCVGAMVLVDAPKVTEGAEGYHYSAMKLLSHLNELDSHPRRGWPKRPVALIFSKADEVQGCRDDPSGYARTHTPALWRYCQERLSCCRFFAAGVAGTCVLRETTQTGPVHVPLRIEPHGIIEPFEWLVEKLAGG